MIVHNSMLRSTMSSFLLPTGTNLPLDKRISLLPVFAASVSSQVNHPIKSEMSLCVGAHNIPHPNKIEKGGEDAFFVSSYGGGAIAVADGVSGWAKMDVDPSLFSRELMSNASSLIEDTEVDFDPQALLKKAHAATSSGGSAIVDHAGQVMFSTSPQEHYFDCPYQVSSVNLKEGDIVVMGSDGLFDNVFVREIVSTVTSYNDVTEAAIARLARDHSMDSNFDSPYSTEARNKGVEVPPSWKTMLGMKLTGGKMDDITVVVGEVVKLTENTLDEVYINQITPRLILRNSLNMRM